MKRQFTPVQLEFKKAAKRLAKEKGLKPTTAHEILAREMGFKTYNSFLAKTGKDHEN